MLGLIAAGPKNRENFSRFPLCDKTVGDHLSNVSRELGMTACNRVAIRAREAGMGGGGRVASRFEVFLCERTAGV